MWWGWWNKAGERAPAEVFQHLQGVAHGAGLDLLLFDSGRALSVHVYDLAMNVPGGEPNAYRSAFALLAMILALNSVVAWLGKRWLAQGIGVR